jgi:hypothetical protein
MEKRAQRARRLLNVLTKLHRIEEQKKFELQRRYDELERSQREVIHALNAEDALHGMFIDTTARLLRSLSTEAQRVGEARDAQSVRLRERAVKVKTAERLKKTLEKNTDQIRKESELRDIIERYVGRSSASLP